MIVTRQIRFVEVGEYQVRLAMLKFIAGFIGHTLIHVQTLGGVVDIAFCNVFSEVVVDGAPTDNAGGFALCFDSLIVRTDRAL